MKTTTYRYALFTLEDGIQCEANDIKNLVLMYLDDNFIHQDELDTILRVQIRERLDLNDETCFYELTNYRDLECFICHDSIHFSQVHSQPDPRKG